MPISINPAALPGHAIVVQPEYMFGNFWVNENFFLAVHRLGFQIAQECIFHHTVVLIQQHGVYEKSGRKNVKYGRAATVGQPERETSRAMVSSTLEYVGGETTGLRLM